MKTVFTTGEAAKVCKVSQQTIIRCFDNGQLKGFRVPGSRFRRIPREALYKFMKDNGIPTDALESGKRKVLLVDDDAELVDLMTKVLEEDGRFEVRVAGNGFDAGMMVKEYRPDIIVLDVMLPDINGKEVCHRVRADTSLEDVRILCIRGMIDDAKLPPDLVSLPALAQTAEPPELAARLLAEDGEGRLPDWSLPGRAPVLGACLRYAANARRLAGLVKGCDPDKAWACGLLAPLGW